MLNIVKSNLLNKSKTIFTLSEIKTSKHFPSSIREWNNSIYVYNKNSLNLLPVTTLSVIKLIKSYFTLFNHNVERKIRTEKLLPRFRRLSSNKIYISNGEFKHTNNKVIINLYLFNRQKHNYILALKKLYLKAIFKNNKNSKFNFVDNKYKINKFNRFITNNTKINDLKKNFLEKLKNTYEIKDFECKLNKIKQAILKLRWKIFFEKLEKKRLLGSMNFILWRKKYKLNTIRYNKLYKHKLRSHRFIITLRTRVLKLMEESKNLNNKLKIANKKSKDLNNVVNYNNFNKYFIKKIKLVNKKSLLLLKLMNEKKYLVIKNLKQSENKKINMYISSYIISFHRNFIKKSLKRLQLYFYYRQLIYINKSKYHYNYLQYLSKHLYHLYNKNIEYNLVNLKRFYLHSDILSESMTLKLANNRRRMFKYLSILKQKVKIKRENFFLSKKIINNNLNLKINPTTYSNSLENNILDKLKYKHILGFRLQAKGRLTRRHKAARSVSKIKYKGNLLNIDCSYKGLSTVLLKGNLRSNVQYTKLKSKSRIGSFGIKGWISGN